MLLLKTPKITSNYTFTRLSCIYYITNITNYEIIYVRNINKYVKQLSVKISHHFC